MDKKKLDFIVKHFGCKTTINGEDVLTSLGNASTVSTNDFWNVFTGDAENYFDIWKTENDNMLSLTLDDNIRKRIEKELGI